ncbi:hypothetical protein JTF06_08940 [Desemzia sp. RIT804]|uniref:hypothetical protein n=1 Tax=Desemzia sp. RIT 804 TaxID=2810209 RepID=UPI00195207E7|nr:hypothetical protein [Desemzia sp. RIT 804]MBM6615016.1 hypothetical protein [Desemzia sp. RIT 804]
MKDNLTVKTLFLSTSALLVFGCGNNEVGNVEEDSTEQSTESSSQDEDIQSSDKIESSKEIEGTAEGESGNGSQIEDEIGNDFDETEMREYVRSLAENPEAVEEQALENLELRGIHQNTFIYSGRVHPDNIVYMQFEGDTEYSNDKIDIEVNDEGYFTIVFDEWNLESHDEVLLTIAVPGVHREDVFHLPIHAAKEGMEVIETYTAPEEEKTQLSESLELNTIYPTTLVYNSPFNGQAEAVAYQMNDKIYTVQTPETGDEGSTYFQTLFEEYPEAGQLITFYIPMNGVIATVKKEVEEISEEAQTAIAQIQEQTEFSAIGKDKGEAGEENNATVFHGKTVPNAHIAIAGEKQSDLASIKSDENGDFTLSFYPPLPQEEDMLYFTIRDEDGYTETFEIKAE